jgi:ABC-2 type transport system permease protein
MSTAIYTRLELLRTFRNRRFFMFSLVLPLVLYYLIAAPQQGEDDIGGTGIDAPTYFMVGLAAFGAMMASISSGARIAAERQIGWNRQLRITPLGARRYLLTKVLTAYVTAIASLVLLFVAGATLGVRIPAGEWLEMTGLMLVGLVPFAAAGIMLGHVLTTDTLGPAVGGSVSLLAFLGGVWFPITSGFLHSLAQALPSYWLVQASHVAIGGAVWGAKGWAIMGAWSIAMILLAAWAYRRDTKRV